MLHVFGMKGELEDGKAKVFFHNRGDVISHHTHGTILYDGRLHLDTTTSGGGLENSRSTYGLRCEGYNQPQKGNGLVKP